MKRGFSHFKRPCKNCEEYFIPSTKCNKICSKCDKKIKKKAQKKVVYKTMERARLLRESRKK